MAKQEYRNEDFRKQLQQRIIDIREAYKISWEEIAKEYYQITNGRGHTTNMLNLVRRDSTKITTLILLDDAVKHCVKHRKHQQRIVDQRYWL